MKQTTANYDEPWKEALSEYFEAFLCFFFPEVHQLIDWTKIPESLEKVDSIIFLENAHTAQTGKEITRTQLRANIEKQLQKLAVIPPHLA